MKPNNVVIFIEALDHFNFFTRMNDGLKELGISPIFITLKLSIYYKLKNRNLSCHLVWNSKINHHKKINLTEIIEYKGKFQNEKEVYKTYNSIYQILEEINSETKIGLFFIFGGYSISGIVQRDFAKENNIPTLYFELSNIPGKLFIDSMGTNARSTVFHDYNLLSKFNIDDSTFNGWIKNYIETKLRQNDIPQSEKVKSINSGYFLDWVGFLFLRIPRGTNRGFYSQVKNKLLIKFYNLRPDQTDLSGLKYVFYPMQVSTDAQILINSNFTNSTAIEYAGKIAQENNLDLVIKLHPAEKNYDEIRILKKLKQQKGFILSDENTFQLINNSDEVITINSTVGLESLILNKRVTVLGESFYKHFSHEQLKNYLLGYLINIDFFSKEPISREAVNLILSRVDFQE